MPTRALGALLAAIAAAAFVVSILSGAWWDGHPRVDGKVFTAKDVHIGLLGGTGCNTGGTGECQPLPLGATFTTVAYGELGGLGLTIAFAILVAGAAWRIAESRKRLAKLGMVIAALAATGALVLLVLGPQIKTSQHVVPPIGWGFMLFGGGIVAMLGACLATLRVEREPLRLKTGVAKAPGRAMPAADPTAFDVREILPQAEVRPTHGAMFEHAPQLRPLYDVQGALPQPPPPMLPQRAPTPMPRASAHQLAGLDPPRAPTEMGPPPPAAPTFTAPRPASSTAPPPFVPPPPPAGPLLQPPPGAPIASPGRPELPRAMPPPTAPPPAVPPPPSVPPPMRAKPTTAPPPPRTKPTMPPAPFASPAIASSALGASRPSAPSIPAPPKLPGMPNPPGVASAPSASGAASRPGLPSAPSVAAPADPLAQTMPAPARVPPPPRAAKISVPPPRRDAQPPTPTPSIITSAPKPDAPAPRSSQPTMTHAVPPMPQIDTPPPALVRGGTENDSSLDTAMRETDFVTAVEIDHEAKARYEEERRLGESATVAAPPLQGEVPGDDTDAIQTEARERIDDAPHDQIAPPPAKAEPAKPEPAKPAPQAPFKSLTAAKLPITTAPASLPPPKSAQIPSSGPTPACPQCEAPMAWVEEHLRFYCRACRMYF